MRRKTTFRSALIFFALGGALVVWLALLVAPTVGKDIIKMIEDLNGTISKPFSVTWHENSIKTILVFLGVYIFALMIYYASRKNYRHGEEHGSAKWGNVFKLGKKYKNRKVREDNKILTQNFSIGLDDRKHRRNTNILVVGASGTGKSRFFVKPNILQCNSSIVVTDPKGELTRDTGNLLKEQGYDVKVFDILNMENSCCYNPFAFLDTDNDVQLLNTNLVKATTPKGAKTSEPFWDVAAAMLLSAIVYYLKYKAPEYEQNFSMVLDMLRAGGVTDPGYVDKHQSPMDELFERLRMEEPEHIAVKYYDLYRSGSDKTIESIQITLAGRLEKFNLTELGKITSTNDIDLVGMGERKVALFFILPTNDTSFNFIVSMLYTQLFQQLFKLASNKYGDKKHGGRLPVPVHLIMDEFANVALPDDFANILSVMRSYGVSATPIIQDLAQLKFIFEKNWGSIVGNCDSLLFLGGNEADTVKYISERLGKETIDTKTYSRSKGKMGNFSTNWQNAGRELLTPSEVAELDNDYAILFVRGEKPVMDRKYDLFSHPRIQSLTDGKGEAYIHGVKDNSSFEITIVEEEEVEPDVPVIDLDVVDLEELGLTEEYEVIKRN